MAAELDPVSSAVGSELGTMLQAVGRLEDAVEQYRSIVELDATSETAWRGLSFALLQVGDYGEGLAANLNHARLIGADTTAAREGFEALMRYAQTGEPQSFPSIWPTQETEFYARSGQRERALEGFRGRILDGRLGGAARLHVQVMSDLLGDDPRYQALLEEAGTTW